MMKLTLPFPDISIPNHLPDWAMGWLFGKGIDYLLKNRKTIFRPKNFGKNFGWFQICTLAICFILLYQVGRFFKKFHVKPLATFMDNTQMHMLKSGFGVLKRIEPDFAYFIYKKLQAFVHACKVGKITGVHNFDEVFKL